MNIHWEKCQAKYETDMLASLKDGCLVSAALCHSTIFEVIVALLSHFAQENVIFQNDFLTQITLPHTSLPLSLPLPPTLCY